MSTEQPNAMDNRDREQDVDLKPDAAEGSGSSKCSLDLSNPDHLAIVNELGDALKLLGADSALQSAFNSILEGDFDLALEFLRKWNDVERDRIAAVMRGYARLKVWAPDREYRDSVDRGCSRQVSLVVQTPDQLVES